MEALVKSRVIVLLFLSSLFLFAGYDGFFASVDIYDSDTGLYYKSIQKNEKKSGLIFSKSATNLVCNINIYNPKNKTSTTIFRRNDQQIVAFLFEMGYEKDHIVFFDRADHIKNNKNIKKSAIKNRLLIATYDSDTQKTTLYSCKKDGKDLKKIATLKSGYSWHIDVKNSKIRAIYAKEGEFKMEVYDW